MFITFEGIEGAGKGTMINRTMNWLQEMGHAPLLTREPGGCELGLALRKILLNTNNTFIKPRSELFLYLADRAQHVEEIIRPALAAGKMVISDRYADSTIIYQGYGRGLDPEQLFNLNDAAVDGLWPDLTFVLDLDPKIGLERAISRNLELGIDVQEGRFEAEALAFHQRVRQGYLEWAAKSNGRIKIIDATGDAIAVFERIKLILEQFLPAKSNA